MANILVTGGAGYVGAILVPKLINAGHNVKVIDLMIFGEDIFEKSNFDNSKLQIIKGDIRNQELLKKSMKNIDCVIHLACISNDPSFELNPELGKSINFDSFRPLVEIAKENKVKRFIYASSSSVYGVKEEPNVHEDVELTPLTDYSKFKALCESILMEYQSNDFTTLTIRPATVCGYSPRQRLDVIVNILTNFAYNKKSIKVFGGDQLRPNIHIEDMTDLYLKMIDIDKIKIAGKIFNAGHENHTVNQLANTVKKVIGDDIEIIKTSSDDNRSYHISSKKIEQELGFKPTRSIEEAVSDLKKAFNEGLLPNSFDDKKYFNIKTMNESKLV